MAMPTLKQIIGSITGKLAFERTQENFTIIKDAHNALETKLTTHEAEKVSQVIMITRDISLTGLQTINTLPNRKIKAIISFGAIQGTKKWSQGMWGEGGNAYCNYSAGDTGNYYTGTAILLFSDLGAVNRTIGNLAVYEGFFQINWNATGAGATGNADMRFLVLYHD